MQITKYCVFLGLLILMPISTIALAQISRTSAIFLRQNPDARGRSLAGGGSVYSTGAISSYYNPANLTSSGLISVEISSAKILPELTKEFSFKSIYISRGFGKWGYYGVGYNYFNYGDWFYYDRYGNYTKHPNIFESAISLSTAFNFNENNSFGFGIKYIHDNFSTITEGNENHEVQANSFAFDIGMQSRNIIPRLTLIRDRDPDSPEVENINDTKKGGLAFGVSVLNMGSKRYYFNYVPKEPIPTILRLALGYKIMEQRNCNLSIMIDVEKLLIDKKEIIWHAGVESQFYKIITLRLGNINNKAGSVRYWASGISLGPSWIHGDYSYVFKSSEEWNRNGGEYALSIVCNLFPNTLNQPR
jgi:hypothetical protein